MLSIIRALFMLLRIILYIFTLGFITTFFYGVFKLFRLQKFLNQYFHKENYKINFDKDDIIDAEFYEKIKEKERSNEKDKQ